MPLWLRKKVGTAHVCPFLGCVLFCFVFPVYACPAVCQSILPAIRAGDWDTSVCVWAGFHKCPALLDSAFVAQMGLAGGISSRPEIQIPKRLFLP